MLTRGARAATASTARCTTGHHFFPGIAFDHGEHRIRLVGQPGIANHPNRFGDDLADALTHTQRGDRKRDEHRHPTSVPTYGAGLAASRPMRVLVQRVSSAAVSVDGRWWAPSGRTARACSRSSVSPTATIVDKARRLAEKLWNLRILADEQSAADVNAPILVVSQFTLYADTAKGRRPSWNAAAPGAVAEPLVDGVRGGVARAGRPRARPASSARTCRSNW